LKFPHVHELSFVSALPIALVERAMPFITVYSGKARVNINDAAAEVIAALPGMTPDRVNAFLTQRKLHPDKTQDLLQLLGTAEQYATNEGSSAFRVESRIAFDNGRQAHSEVVILLFDQGDEPFSVLSWRDDLDGYRSIDQARTRVQ
jgi:general secretion pathway protein K